MMLYINTTLLYCTTTKAQEIIQRRIAYSEVAFAEVVVWLLAAPLAGSSHQYKYRLAYVVDEMCMVRLDNEAGTGDHLHFGQTESAYAFVSISQLLADFNQYIQRWNHESGHT
jgi:hypothetical protein